MVATTLNRPFAIRSVSSSMAWSEDDGEFKREYVDGIWATFGWEGVGCNEVEGSGNDGGGRREKNEGEGDMKDRY